MHPLVASSLSNRQELAIITRYILLFVTTAVWYLLRNVLN